MDIIIDIPDYFSQKGGCFIDYVLKTKANGWRKPPTKAGGCRFSNYTHLVFIWLFQGPNAKCTLIGDSYIPTKLPTGQYYSSCGSKNCCITRYGPCWSSLLLILQPGHFEDFHRLDTRLRIIEGQTQLLGPQVEVAPINCLSFDGDFSERTKLQKLLANTQNDFKRQSSLLVQRFQSLFPCFLA